VDVVRLSPGGGQLRELLAGVPVGGILGITGAPGAGKSTLAAAVATRVAGAVVVPMDGFHLADVELRRRGLLSRKGAPETFDGWGYAALLSRLRARPDHVVMAPGFERDLEQPLAGAIPVPPGCPLVVTEGNYLLLDTREWRSVRRRIDQVWHVVTEDPLRRSRLVARHVAHGKDPEAARAWVARVDQPNAELVEGARERADLVLDLTQWRG
jgi:pantothenate kinase